MKKIDKEFLSKNNVKETSNGKGFWMYKKDFYQMNDNVFNDGKSCTSKKSFTYGMITGLFLTVTGVLIGEKLSEVFSKKSKIDFDFSEEDI